MHATLQILEFQNGSIPMMRVFGIHLDSKLKLNPYIDLRTRSLPHSVHRPTAYSHFQLPTERIIYPIS
jgi:hypothetical protein